MPTPLTLQEEDELPSAARRFEGKRDLFKDDEEDEDEPSPTSCAAPRGDGAWDRERIRARALKMQKSTVAKYVAAESFRRISLNSRKEYFANDISASPRISGYAFCMVASLLVFVSAMKFKFDKGALYVSELFGQHVAAWKLNGAIVFGALGFGLCVLIISCHFDTVVMPLTWCRVFKDGSVYERHLLHTLIVFWTAGVYTCTSSYSVGLNVPNVHFSSWLALLTLVHTYDTWRIGAGLTSYYQMVKESPHPTTANLVGVTWFSVISSLSLLDYFGASRRWSGEPYNEYLASVPIELWIFALGASGLTFVVGLSLLLLNHLTKAEGKMRCLLVYLEGFALFCFTGIWIYICFTQTGVDEYLNGNSNVYFGFWGTFLMSILSFGSWLTGGSKSPSERSQ